MGLRHSSRCLLLRRKMAEADSSEVGGEPCWCPAAPVAAGQGHSRRAYSDRDNTVDLYIYMLATFLVYFPFSCLVIPATLRVGAAPWWRALRLGGSVIFQCPADVGLIGRQMYLMLVIIFSQLKLNSPALTRNWTWLCSAVLGAENGTCILFFFFFFFFLPASLSLLSV